MVSQKKQLLCMALVLLTFILLNTSTTAQEEKPKEAKGAESEAKPTPKEGEGPKEGVDGFKAVDEFCNQRRTMEDRAFCKKVLKSNPKSATAKDNPTLLKIAIELAVGNSKRTRDFFRSLLIDKDTPPPVKAGLPPCITAYDNSIKQLTIIDQDLEDDPPMANFDARMAAQQVSLCEQTLGTGKITEPSILSRNKIAVKYSGLVEELSNAF